MNKTLTLMHVVWGWVPPAFFNMNISPRVGKIVEK